MTGQTTPPIAPGPLGGARPGACSRGSLAPLGVAVMHCQALLGFMFLFAAYNKLWGTNAPQLFSASVQAFKTGMPGWGVRLTTGITPWVEVIAGLLLLMGVWARAAATVLSGLLIVFIVLIVQAILRGLDLECGCFGKLSPFCPPKVGLCNLVQNGILLAMGLLIALTPRHRLVSPAGGDNARPAA